MTAGLDPRCEAARLWISAAVDGEATESERLALRTHLAECAACRSFAALAESVSLHVRTSAPVAPTREIVLAPPAAARRRRRRLTVVAATPLVAAAALAGVLASVVLNRPATSAHVRQPAAVTVASRDQGGFIAGLGQIDAQPRDGRVFNGPLPVHKDRLLPGDRP